MADELHPQSGVRVRLDLESTDDEGARYRVTLFFANEQLNQGGARIPIEGSAAIEGLDESPVYAQAAAKAFLRQTQGAYRAAGRWPRRVLRWRAERMR